MALVARISLPLRGREDIQSALDALTGVDRRHLAAVPTPPLYGAGVVYRREGRGLERWQTVPQVIAAGAGDCEDLCAWRAAELQLAGVDARAVPLRWGPRQWHVLVAYPGGEVEDPSIELGMPLPDGVGLADILREAEAWNP